MDKSSGRVHMYSNIILIVILIIIDKGENLNESERDNSKVEHII